MIVAPCSVEDCCWGLPKDRIGSTPKQQHHEGDTEFHTLHLAQQHGSAGNLLPLRVKENSQARTAGRMPALPGDSNDYFDTAAAVPSLGAAFFTYLSIQLIISASV